MAKPLLTDALWKRIEPLLPPHKPRRRRFPGRKPIDDRKALTGILFVLKTGINWEDLPQEMGCGCGMTCWRRLRDWHQAGVWQRLHETLLAELHEADRIDWARALIDSSFVRARGGGGRTGPSPVDRRKRGSKHQIITDAGGIPLVADTTAANVPDVNLMIPLVDAIPPGRGKPGRPRRRPASLYGDRGYDSDPHRRKFCRAASVRTSRDGGRHMGAGWERIAGTWSGRCRGCTTSGGCEFARIKRPRSIRLSSSWLAR